MELTPSAFAPASVELALKYLVPSLSIVVTVVLSVLRPVEVELTNESIVLKLADVAVLNEETDETTPTTAPPAPTEIAVEVEVLNESKELLVVLKPVEVDVLNESTLLPTVLKPVEVVVLNEDTALLVLLKPVELDVLNESSELPVVDKPAPIPAEIAVEVEVLNESTTVDNDVTLLPTVLIPVEVEVLNEITVVDNEPK